MDTNATVPTPAVEAPEEAPPTVAPFAATLPPSVAIPAIATRPQIPVLPAYAKPFLDIIIEHTNSKEQKATKVKQMTTKANFVQTDPKRYKHKAQNSDNKPKIYNPHNFKYKDTCFFLWKTRPSCTQCRKIVKTRNSGNPPKDNLVEGDDIIVVVVS